MAKQQNLDTHHGNIPIKCQGRGNCMDRPSHFKNTQRDEIIQNQPCNLQHKTEFWKQLDDAGNEHIG